ncbi:Protein CCC1 [Tolypocladium ophioglossoides CBS 100239]|uniref:Protein CCC1 n=1 Tax=Tolypocladium ophioglossoides (strain CBS 100239) TaxID=1163406 RepID=A0A0L0NM92_TOLOC|nr:Protein CCC1 [Tolypocladium ophioglossoides CBS 100239]
MAKLRSPCLTRFLSDFTLGFSDGLTVPFALTAGLSSLGRADTVIYAGLAELCAGSISMGIGGYLSALDEVPAASSHHSSSRGDGGGDGGGDEEELRGMLHDGSASGASTSSDSSSRGSIDEKDKGREASNEELVRRHLDPLALPGSTVSDIMAALRRRPDGLSRAALKLQQQQEDAAAAAACSSEQRLPIWPVASGLSISLGYVVGGIIPLFPYLFAATVGLALRWSICLCLLALMAFGSGKSWVLRGEDRSWRRCLVEGVQMLVLGSLAAGAAVLCVNMVGGAVESAG